MRFPFWCCCLVLSALYFTPILAGAQGNDPSADAARAEARRDLAAAKMESQHYWQVEYPCRRRELNAAIEMTEAEVKANKLLLSEYGPFDKFAEGRAFVVTIQDTRMCLRDAELRLEALRQERNNLIRFHSDEGRLLDLRVSEARARVIELEGGEVIEIGNKQ